MATIAVLINIIEARDLKPRSSSGMCDPVLVVETMGEKQHTSTMKKDLSPYWNHYFHIEEKSKDFQRETLDISVYDTATTFRKELIGSFEFELSDIYAQQNHEYFGVWVILSNHTLPGKPGVQGYLKLSVTVLKPGDTPIQHTEEAVEESDSQEDNLANMVLLKPKGLDAIEHTLKAKIFKAENLPKMATIGVCDPFIEVKYANNTNRSRVEKNTASPVWNEEVNLPVTMPSMADTITMSLYDHDVGKNPELISRSFLSCKSVQEKAQAGFKGPSWVNFYKGKGQGNEAFEYCGRVLSSVGISTGEGKAAVIPVSTEPEPPTSSYTLQLDVYECQGVDAPLYPIYVTASVGPYSCKTHPIKIKNKSAEFYESVPDLDFSLPSDSSQVPDLFIYVYEDVPGSDKRHGYLRYSHDQLEGLQSGPRWEVLKRVTSQSKDDEHPPGFLHFKVSFAPSAVLKQKPRPKITKLAKKPWQLRAHLYVARNLPAGDEDALSDPYCLVNISSAKGKSKTKEHTIFPDWFETVVLDVELPEQLNLAPDIYVSVYDHDTLTPDEFLGRVVVNINASGDVSTNKNINAPKWFPLVLGDKVKGKGEVLASFQLLPSDIAHSTPMPDLHPKLVDSEIDIGVIGLRNLAPFQLLPVSNPYIKFTCPGVNKPITTKPSKIPVPMSPNFFENIVLPIALPEVLDFIPALLIEVFDSRPGKDAKVAATSIPLSAFVPWGVNSTAKLPYGVRLPPSVDESSFYQTPAPLVPAPQSSSASTGSAIVDIKLDKAEHTIDVAAPDVLDNELSTLLPKGDKGKSVQLISVKRDVPTTTIPGMEDEPDEPKRQEFVTEVEHQMQSFPFLEVDLYRGTSAGISSGNLFNKPESIVGKFKGAISVRALSGSSKKPDNRSKLDVTKLNIPRPYVVRVYIEQGQNLVPHDENGSSDPYLVLYNSNPSGKNKGNIIKDVENVKPHTLQPDFYKMYELKGLLPDDNELVVQVWDKDIVGSDEFIGETRYDLEMLWFSEDWRKMQLKPKENRTLWNPLSAFPQGKLKMWVELLTLAEAGSTPPSPIGPPLREPFELRIVIWETRNVVPKDKLLGKDSSDQFVATKLLNHPQSAQQTDVHDSVMDGCGKFNWRIIYADVFLPYDTPRLKLQVYDKDRIGPNDAIAEANLNLKGFFQKALRQKSARIGALAGQASIGGASAIVGLGTGSKDSTNSAGPYNTGQWLDLFHPSYDGPQGSICLEVELLAREEAAAKRAGNGRNEPNQNPFLPAPVRPSRKWFSDLFSFLGLDKFKKYIIGAGVALVVIIVIVVVVQFT